MLTRMTYRLSCFVLLCTGKAADLHKTQRSGERSLGQLVEEANDISDPDASVSVAALGQMHVNQKSRPSGSGKNSFSIVRSDATSAHVGQDLPFSATASFAEQTPQTSGHAMERCVVPMWGPGLYLCQEAKDVEADYTWTDTNGNDRKSMADGAKCSVSCPDAGYWKASSVSEMFCSKSRWHSDPGGGVGTEVKELKCKPSKFVFVAVALFFAGCCLCTGVGFTKGAKAHLANKAKTQAEMDGMHDPSSPYYDPHYDPNQAHYGYDASGHYDPNAAHYDPSAHYDPNAAHYDQNAQAGHYDPNAQTEAGHYDPNAQQQEQPIAGSFG